jgi:hypothetical protein
MKSTVFVFGVLLSGVAAQQAKPVSPTVEVPQDSAAQDAWSDGFGRGPSYRSALADALEDAVTKAKGVAIARGPAIRSRIAVVKTSSIAGDPNSLERDLDRETEWVQHQISGFVRSYEVVKSARGDDQLWEVRVRARIAALDQMASEFVIELVDNDLREWQMERFEEGGRGQAFHRRKGAFKGPRIGEFLRRSGAVKIASSGDGVQLTNGSDRAQREKHGHELVASHCVTISWQPLLVQSMVEKPNRARPTSGPRPEYMREGSVEVALRIENLVERTVVLEETFTTTADNPAAFSADRIDAFVTRLVDKAKAEVASKIYFSLQPPVVLRKWAGEGGAWHVTARMSRRVAAGYPAFVVGNNGTLANPDWQQIAGATLVGGSGNSCTFRLDGLADPAVIAVDVSEVRPAQ